MDLFKSGLRALAYTGCHYVPGNGKILFVAAHEAQFEDRVHIAVTYALDCGVI